jgi:hypothetical protein
VVVITGLRIVQSQQFMDGIRQMKKRKKYRRELWAVVDLNSKYFPVFLPLEDHVDALISFKTHKAMIKDGYFCLCKVEVKEL